MVVPIAVTVISCGAAVLIQQDAISAQLTVGDEGAPLSSAVPCSCLPGITGKMQAWLGLASPA